MTFYLVIRKTPTFEPNAFAQETTKRLPQREQIGSTKLVRYEVRNRAKVNEMLNEIEKAGGVRQYFPSEVLALED